MKSSPKLITPPAAPIIDVDAMKVYLRVDHGDDDTLIGTLIEAATSHLDGHTGVLGRALISQTWEQEFDISGKSYALDIEPVQADSAVLTVDGNVITPAHKITETAAGTVLEFTDALDGDSLTVRYTAGVVAEDIPAAIVVAVKIHVAELCDNRGFDSNLLEKNSGYIALIHPFKKRRVG